MKFMFPVHLTFSTFKERSHLLVLSTANHASQTSHSTAILSKKGPYTTNMIKVFYFHWGKQMGMNLQWH